MGQLGRAGYGSVAIVIEVDAKEGELPAELPEAAVRSVESTPTRINKEFACQQIKMKGTRETLNRPNP